MTRGRKQGQRMGPYTKRAEKLAEATPQRKARLHMGITQAELADKAGVALKTVRKWEAGQALAWRTENALSTIVGLPLWLQAEHGSAPDAA